MAVFKPFIDKYRQKKMLPDHQMQLKLNDRHIEILSMMKKGAGLGISEFIFKGIQDLMFLSTPEEMFLLMTLFESEISSQLEAQTFSEGFTAYFTANRGSSKVQKVIEIFQNIKQSKS